MGGGLMQIVAYGAQDVYLTGNPQITFFKVVYRRHTNFAMESIAQTFNGNSNFGKCISALYHVMAILSIRCIFVLLCQKLHVQKIQHGDTSANWAVIV
jgi:hypothetical protein